MPSSITFDLDNYPYPPNSVFEARPQHSFWLQISMDRFHLDFVCELTYGRFLSHE